MCVNSELSGMNAISFCVNCLFNIIFNLDRHIFLDCVESSCQAQAHCNLFRDDVHSSAVFRCHHIEWIRGINAYSLACSQSQWQVCVGAWVNIHVGSMLSNSAGMTVQASPGTCSVKPVSQVHLETRLSLPLPGAPKGPLLTFNILCYLPSLTFYLFTIKYNIHLL